MSHGVLTAKRPGVGGSETIDMDDAQQSFEQGDRVALMRMAPVTGDIQIIEATVVGMVDDYQVVIRFPGGTDLTLPVGELTRMPPR